MPKPVEILFFLGLAIAVITGTAYPENRLISDQARVHELPNENSIILDVLTPGMRVELVREQGSWAQVRLPGTAEMGWVEKRVLGKAPSRQPIAAPGKTGPEIRLVEGRLSSMNQSLRGIEARVDKLLNKIELTGIPTAAQETPYKDYGVDFGRPQATAPGEPVPFDQTGDMIMPGETEKYGWRNSFLAYKYLKGRQDCYGLAISRSLGGGGKSWLDAEIRHGLGRQIGNEDDFIEWDLGLTYKLKPQIYRIYPFISAHFGMRHMLENETGASSYLTAMPGIGINAEMNSIFSISIQMRAVFLFDKGERFDEQQVSISFTYRY